VEALYGFDSGRSKRAIAENRKIAEGLKEDKGFVYEVCFSFFLLNDVIYSVFRFFPTTMASEKVYTTTP
jgi:hypothetical protein